MSDKLNLIRCKMTPLELGYLDTSPTPRGQFKQAWIMKLRRSGHRCQLPRGFSKKGRTLFVG